MNVRLPQLSGALLLFWAGAAGAQTVVNPSFEADSFAIFPGYVSANGPITGWASGPQAGINPGVGFAPFTDNGVIPDGTKAVFIQGDSTLSQMVSGFTVGAAYYVRYFENARNCCGGTAALELKVGGTTLVPAHVVTAVGGNNPYREVKSGAFVASAATLEVAFVKSTAVAGDNTALIDNVSVVAIPPGTIPSVVAQPQSQSLLVGATLELSVRAIGSLPLSYQWRFRGLDLPNQTAASLSIANVSEANAGRYVVVVSNNSGSVTSSVANVVINRPLVGLFDTGVDDAGNALPDNSVDPHYTLTVNPDTGSLDAIVEDSTLFPIVAGPWLANSATSKWIGPQVDTTTSAADNYTYTTTFDLGALDPTTAVITGAWAVDNVGLDIVLNGTSLGIMNNNGFAGLTPFTISSGFVAGLNTLDFQVQNQPPPGWTGLRIVGISGSARPPGSAPVITSQPQGQTVAAGDSVTFTVVANGTAPLTYQWLHDGTPVQNATGPSLSIPNVTSGDAGSYVVVVNNNFGNETSEPAVLSIVGVRISGLFNTGVDDAGVALADGAVDPHYLLVVNPDIPGSTDAVVHDSTIFPIVAGPWVANNDQGKWISPQLNTAGSAGGAGDAGNYTYRLSFDLTGLNHTTAQLEGDWATDNLGLDILLNGVSLGIPNGNQFTVLTHFAIPAGHSAFRSGVNMLEFSLNNSAVGYTGLRVQNLRGQATAIPPGSCPEITRPPASREARVSETVTFSVSALGTPPLTYQWRKNNGVLNGETNPTLTLPNVSAGDAGTYSVEVVGLSICPSATASATLVVRPRLALDIAELNRISISGYVGRSYRIEFSDNGGQSYSTLTTVVVATDPQDYVDLGSRDRAGRIYRVVLLP